MTHDPSLGETKDYTGIPPSGSETPKETSTPRAETPIQGDTVEGNDTQHSGSDPLRTIDFAGESDMPMSFPDIPGYEIEKELGRGGMGVVYKAKQKGLDRTVALKMILKADFATSEQKLRFQIEAENAARVQHPNIVQVFEIGEHHGQPYFAQEFIDGGSLADWLKKGRMSTAEAAALIETLARAVHAAHVQGIIHRDLKPANVLLTSPGRESGEFTPKITDFGLAKRLDQTEHLTGSHAVMGTPTYMSPEQAQGKTKFVGPAADQYALGVIFYQLLTGKVPFEADTIPNLLIKITTDEPASPRNINPSIPHDLQVICLKCLEKDATKRYLTAEALAEDLRNWREHRPITARPATRLERVTKWCRRYPAIAALIVVSTLAAVIASGLAWWAVAAERQAEANERQALRERDLKEKQRLRAENNEKLAEGRLAQVKAEKKKVEEEKLIAQGVRSFLQDSLIRRASKWEEASARRKLKAPGAPAQSEVTINSLLDLAANEFDPTRIESRFPNQPLVQAEILETIGETYIALENFPRGIEFVKAAMALRERALGPEHPASLAGQVHAAFALLQANRSTEGIGLLIKTIQRVEAMLEEAFDRFSQKTTITPLDVNADPAFIAIEAVMRAVERPMDPRHPGLPASTYGLAEGPLLYLQAMQMLPRLQRMADRLEKLLGADDRRTILARIFIGFALHATGQYDKALKAYLSCLATAERALDQDDLLLLALRQVTAICYEAYDGQLNEACRLTASVVDSLERLVGPEHPKTLGARHDLGLLYLGQSNPSKAQSVLQSTYETAQRSLGDKHLTTLRIRASLGKALVVSGNKGEGFNHLRQVCDIAEKSFGSSDPAIIELLEYLVQSLSHIGHFDEAIQVQKHIHAWYNQHHGSDHADTLATLNDLAMMYRTTGRLDLALPLLEKTLELKRAKLGVEHPDTLKSLNNLALCYQDAGNLDLALPLLEETLRLTKAKLGADHPDTLLSMNNLAVGYQYAGKLNQALPLLEETLRLRKIKLIADHPQTLVSMANLAEGYRVAGQLHLAIPLLEETTRLTKAKLGADHPNTLLSMNNLALGYQDAGKLNQALPLLEETLRQMKANLGADHPGTITSMANLAMCYQDAGKLNLALPLLEETFKLRKAKLGIEHPDTLSSMSNLGLAYRSAMKFELALPLLEEALTLTRAKMGFDHPQTLSCMNNLAVGYKAAGRLSEAIRLFEQVCDQDVPKRGEDHPHTLISMNNLALSYLAAGKLDLALPLLEKILKLRKIKLGSDHADTLSTMTALAQSYREANRVAEALPLVASAADKLEKRQFLHEHASYIMSQTFLTYEAAQQFEKAEEWRRKWLAHVKASAGVESPAYAGELAALGLLLMKQEKWGEAQSTLSECLAIREKIQPDAWTTFNTQSMLGGALLGSARSASDGAEKAKQLTEAESLLLKGCEGIKARLVSESQDAKLLKTQKQRLAEALDRLIELYTALEKSDGVKKWQAEKEKWK